MGSKEGQGDDRVSLAPLDPEEALRALMKVDPEAIPASEPADANERCPEVRQGECCPLEAGHFGPCRYDAR
jgi:hypothetical protein